MPDVFLYFIILTWQSVYRGIRPIMAILKYSAYKFLNTYTSSQCFYWHGADQNYVQWWFVNPGSDNPEILLVQTKSVGTDFNVLDSEKLLNQEISTENKRIRINESSLYLSDKKLQKHLDWLPICFSVLFVSLLDTQATVAKVNHLPKSKFILCSAFQLHLTYFI